MKILVINTAVFVVLCFISTGCGSEYDTACEKGEVYKGGNCLKVPEGMKWIEISGGSYMMGYELNNPNQSPVHEVSVSDFFMNETEVTVAQYAKCVEECVCTEPNVDTKCNWGISGRENHPVNCLLWAQASDFCNWVGGRLATESEWEYAAKSEGKDIQFPWGGDRADCEHVVMRDEVDLGCGTGGTMAVCSKPAGNTDQGLCDMSGNISEYVQDCYHGYYDCEVKYWGFNCADGGVAPSDGSAWESPDCQVMVSRGGNFNCDSYDWLTTTVREYRPTDFNVEFSGFRCAR